MAVKKHPKIEPISGAVDYVSWLLFAESGFGKTVFAGTHPDILIVSVDPEGTISAGRQGAKGDRWVIHDFDELMECYRWLRDGGAKLFRWIVIDSLTEVQKLMQTDWLIKNAGNAGKRHPEVLGMDGYQITQNQVINFVKQMNDLPVNKLYTALTVTEDDEDGEPYYLPLIHGQKWWLARQIAGYMTITSFGSKEKNDIRRQHFDKPGQYRLCKDRTDSLGKRPHRDGLTLLEADGIIFGSGRRSTATKAVAKKTPAKKATATRRRVTTKEK